MREHKYHLPRHTNLANQGPRIGAFLIDLAIALALTLGFYFGVFQFVFKGKTGPLTEQIKKERIASHLFYEGEDGSLEYYSTDSDNNEFKDALASFYTVYLPYESPDKDVKVSLDSGETLAKTEYFTVEWFNDEMLDIDGNGEVYFEYQKVGEEIDKTKVGLIKEDAPQSDVNSFLQKIWNNANADLAMQPSFRKLNNQNDFYRSLSFICSALFGLSITYILIPFILKNGKSVGKLSFGLCLADSDGYVIQNYQLFLRIIPVLIVLFSLLIPIWVSLSMVIIVFIIMLLVSFAFMMASPKRASLHDLLARTIVVNSRTSILFDNAMDEEEYIAKEDGIEIAPKVYGEEPEISYEK